MKGRISCIFTCVLLFACNASLALGDDAASDTGNELSSYCNDGNHQAENTAWFYCVGLVRGISEGAEIGMLAGLYTSNANASEDQLTNSKKAIQRYCIPSGVTYEQMGLVVSKYLKDHPETLNKSINLEVINAFRLAWPCEKN